eukprot:SAG31_NODE_518_length_14674_cov_39.604803_6_plen_149_part_00
MPRRVHPVLFVGSFVVAMERNAPSLPQAAARGQTSTHLGFVVHRQSASARTVEQKHILLVVRVVCQPWIFCSFFVDACAAVLTIKRSKHGISSPDPPTHNMNDHIGSADPRSADTILAATHVTWFTTEGFDAAPPSSASAAQVSQEAR